MSHSELRFRERQTNISPPGTFVPSYTSTEITLHYAKLASATLGTGEGGETPHQFMCKNIPWSTATTINTQGQHALATKSEHLTSDET